MSKSKLAIINDKKEKGTNSLKNMQLLFMIFHKYNLVSLIIEFNKKFYILTQCSMFIGFNWQVKEFTLIKRNNSHALAVTALQPRHHVFRDVEYPELFNNGHNNLQGKLQ